MQPSPLWTSPLRHDWTIDRCGKQVRYVIDFYNGSGGSGGVSMHLDVRPALDDVDGFVDRVRMTSMTGYVHLRESLRNLFF